MPVENSYKNTLLRSGVSRHERTLKALFPEFARVDERTGADLILFAKEYAAYLNYYNNRNQVDGDWIPLMSTDVSVILAGIQKQEVKSFFIYVKQLLGAIKSSGNTQDLKLYYTALFNFLSTLVYELDNQLKTLPPDIAFTEYLRNSISSRLAVPFSQLTQFFRASETEGMINSAKTITSPLSPIEIKLCKNLLENKLSESWAIDNIFTAPINGATVPEKIKNTAEHAVFKGIIWKILKSYSAVVYNAGGALQETLENFPAHEPHYALFLTFIKLFQKAQDQLNNFTGRHLQFYYKDILGMEELPAKPDKVHLLLELQKNRDQHLLKEGTVFKAGKDKNGSELFYELKNDAVLNRGKVKSIRSLRVQKEDSSGDEYSSLFAAPVANSGDGSGAELTTPEKSWKPFGNPATNKRATTGFAIAHPVLYMKEGEREITFRFKIKTSDLELKEGFAKAFRALVTGEEGWHEAEITEVRIESKDLVFTVKLSAADPGFLPYDEDIHQEYSFDARLPVIQFLLKNSPGEYNFQQDLQNLIITEATISVKVNGVKNLSLQNDLGTLDPSKPFPVFTHQPRIGSALIIGSNEVFLKKLDNAAIHLEWADTDWSKYKTEYSKQYNFNKKIEIEFLRDGSWERVSKLTNRDKTVFFVDSKDLSNAASGIIQDAIPSVRDKIIKTGDESAVAYSEKELKNAPGERTFEAAAVAKKTPDFKKFILPLPKGNEQINLPGLSNGSLFDFSPDEPYKISDKYGFLKITFKGTGDFGHSSYSARLIDAVKKEKDLPPEPLTPLVKSLNIDYTASAVVDLSRSEPESFIDKAGYFYHITPFGNVVRHRSFLGSTANISLLPVYNNEGEIYIGLDDFQAGRSIQLLFKVSDGSADPAFSRQEIHWSFLAENNQWVDFGQFDIVDETNSLTKTGIIRFGFPAAATNVNTIMGEQLFWIKGTILENSAAVCDLIAVHAQAIKTELIDFQETGVEFSETLAAGTISKLQISNPAIRKISQPYNSFDGRTKETEQQSSVRISERLRHKNRAISVWDYERMVLQQFPQIYKVKCINHAQISGGQTKNDNELAPGHVLVVPIPDLSGKNAVNPLRPQTDIGTLIEIEDYLRQFTSPFVQLQVKNARFEEIQLDFKVKFHSADGDFLSNQLMDDIEKHLSPWAFNQQEEVEFGGKISKSVLLDFVEKRDYVDYVTCFKMYHIVDGNKSGDVEEAVATSARSVFVSFAGDVGNSEPRHKIDFENLDEEC